MEKIKERLRRLPKPLVALAIIVFAVASLLTVKAFAESGIDTEYHPSQGSDGKTLSGWSKYGGLMYTETYFEVNVYKGQKDGNTVRAVGNKIGTVVTKTLSGIEDKDALWSKDEAKEDWKRLNDVSNLPSDQIPYSAVKYEYLVYKVELCGLNIYINDEVDLVKGTMYYNTAGNHVFLCYSSAHTTGEQAASIWDNNKYYKHSDGNRYARTTYLSSNFTDVAEYVASYWETTGQQEGQQQKPTDTPTPTPTTAPGKIKLTIKDDYYNESGNILQKSTTRKSEDVEAGKDCGQFTYLIASARAYKEGDAGVESCNTWEIVIEGASLSKSGDMVQVKIPNGQTENVTVTFKYKVKIKGPTPTVGTPTPVPQSYISYSSNYPKSAVGTKGYTSGGSAVGDGVFTIAECGYSCKNYFFVCWASSWNWDNPCYSEGETIYVEENHSARLYAQWYPNEYTITYDYSTEFIGGSTGLNKGSIGDSYTNDQTKMWGECVDYEGKRTYKNPTPSKAGYTFLGWSTMRNEYNKNGFMGCYIYTGDTFGHEDEASWDDQTLYATWEPETYTVTLDYNFNYGVTSDPRFTSNKNNMYGDSFNITYNTSYKNYIGTEPTKTGYIFKGWYLSEDSSGNGTGTKISPSDICTLTRNHTLYAKWEPVTVTMSYLGTEAYHAPVTIKYGEVYGTTRLFTPSETGRKFNGWKDRDDVMGSDWKTMKPTDICYHTIDFVANADMTDLPITVYFNYRSAWVLSADNLAGNGTTAKTVYYNNTYGDLPRPTRTGYVFGGWAFDDGSGAPDMTKVIVDKNTPVSRRDTHTLVAIWIPDTINIKLDMNLDYNPLNDPNVFHYWEK